MECEDISGVEDTKEARARALAMATNEKRLKHLAALRQAAELLRDAGDVQTAQTLEERGHSIVKASASVSGATRQFMDMRSAQRMEQERREQEAAAREDAQTKEMEARYRLAKEESLKVRAKASMVLREATRVKVLEAEVLRKSHREMVEQKKSDLLYMQQHLAAYFW